MGLRLLAVAALVAGCGEVDVLNHVSDVEARRAVGALDRAGVAARFEAEEGGRRGAFRVRVDETQVARAVEALAREEVPRREEPGFAEAWGERAMVTTSTEERARSAQAVAGELARTLEAIDGVVDARVHLAPAAETELGDAPRRPSASVLLRYEGEVGVDAAQVRSLVAAAVDGMRAEDVTVVLSRRAPRRERRGVSWVRVGSIVVAQESAGRVWALLAGLAVSLAGLGLAVWKLSGRRVRT